MEIEALISRAW